MKVTERSAANLKKANFKGLVFPLNGSMVVAFVKVILKFSYDQKNISYENAHDHDTS